MDKNSKVAKIFTTEQQFPCGPQSSCCGPVGQSLQEIASLVNAIEEVGLDVQVCDVRKMETVQENPQVLQLFRAFGVQAIPIVMVGEEVACIGQSNVNEIVSAVKSKI